MDLLGPRLDPRLLDPATYPHPTGVIQVVETHISWVILAGDFAYKLKKPVVFPFLDYGSPAKRAACVREEFRLNRRLAPSLYVGLAALGPGPETDSLRWTWLPREDGAKPALEEDCLALCMHRFAPADEADHLCESGALGSDELIALAQHLAAFQAHCPVAGPDSPHGRPGEILAPALENFSEMAALSGAPLKEELAPLRAWTEAEFCRIAPCLEARRKGGRIREGHGDLHLGNLVRWQGELVPFDGIEFNESFRWIDVANEVAFTWVDLLDHGRPGLAGTFLSAWLDATGDWEALGCLRFYGVYRAMVRAKVARIQGLAEVAGRYLNLARRLAQPPRPRLIITHGVSGSGKTWASSRLLLAQTGGDLLRVRSDRERQRPPESAAGQPDRYSPASRAAVYDTLAHIARTALGAGWSLVVDATFLEAGQRQRFRDLAAGLGAEFRILALSAPRSVLEQRIGDRARLAQDASEADVTVLARQLAHQDPLSPAEKGETLEVPLAEGPESLIHGEHQPM